MHGGGAAHARRYLAGRVLKTLVPRLEALLLTGDTPLHLDESGATPVLDDGDRGLQMVFARYLTKYLEEADPTVPIF